MNKEHLAYLISSISASNIVKAPLRNNFKNILIKMRGILKYLFVSFASIVFVIKSCSNLFEWTAAVFQCVLIWNILHETYEKRYFGTSVRKNFACPKMWGLFVSWTVSLIHCRWIVFLLLVIIANSINSLSCATVLSIVIFASHNSWINPCWDMNRMVIFLLISAIIPCCNLTVCILFGVLINYGLQFKVRTDKSGSS